MNKNLSFSLILILIFSTLQLGMAHRDEYDEEAREAERLEKQAPASTPSTRNPIKKFARTMKDATADAPEDPASAIRKASDSEDSDLGPLEGATRGTGKVLDKTMRGAVKVVTLGAADTSRYEVVEPEQGKDEPTKYKFKF